MNYATEIIKLEAGVNYAPTFVRTDNRRLASESTSLGYHQIGELQQYGNAKGPIFKLEFVSLPGLAYSATHIKIWGIDNDDTNAPIYPITYLSSNGKIIDVYLKKFIFCDSEGNEVEVLNGYTVIGYKRHAMPNSYL
jgi:hypothetical protein